MGTRVQQFSLISQPFPSSLLPSFSTEIPSYHCGNVQLFPSVCGQLHTLSTPVFQTSSREFVLPCCANGKCFPSGICNKTCSWVHLAKKVIVLSGNLAGRTGFLPCHNLIKLLEKVKCNLITKACVKVKSLSMVNDL